MPTNEERRKVAARLREHARTARRISQACVLNYCIGENECGNFGIEGCEGCFVKSLNLLADLIEPEHITGETSDGYHTFNELYHHRALLFSVIVRNYPELCWKSKKHHAGDMYDGMFIVGINTPDGQASYHYDVDPYWDMFECEELEFAPEWDGHTPAQAIERIGKLMRKEPEPERTCNAEMDWNAMDDGVLDCRIWRCSCGEKFPYWRGGEPGFCPECGAKVVDNG